MTRFVGIACLAMASLLASGVGKRVSGFDGYVLYGAYGGTITVLIDGNNDTIQKWDHNTLPDNMNGYSCYLLENGNLLRSSQTSKSPQQLGNGVAPKNGILSEIDADGEKIWAYELANMENTLHHDCKVLPNGNIIAISFVTTSEEDGISKGLDSSLFNGFGPFGSPVVQTEKIIEIEPDKTGGNAHKIVWEWIILDHVVPKDSAAVHPEKFSGGLGPVWLGQWVHLNGIDYDPVRDLIVFSSRVFSEVYVIDHSTTTAEAATGSGGKYNKGGDLLYRWGRSKNYCIPGDSITTLHCPTWIPTGYANAGNIMFFHNNCLSTGYGGFVPLGGSQVIEITPPVNATGNFVCTENTAFGPAAPTWKYAPVGADSIFSMSMSSAIRMKNGNTIVHEAYTVTESDGQTSTPSGGSFGGGNNGPSTGASRIREVTPEGTVVGTPIMCTTNPAKIMYYEKDYPGIIELFNKLGVANKMKELSAVKLGIPGIVCNILAKTIDFSNVGGAEISFYSLQGKMVASAKPSTAAFNFSTKELPTGAYLVKIKNAAGGVTTHRFNML